MIHWYWVPVWMIIASGITFGLCRFFDSKLDKIFDQIKAIGK